MEKNFIRVKIADPGNQLLIQQDCFHGAATFSENCSEPCGVKLQRIRANAACLPSLRFFDLAKFPLIVERQAAVVHKAENHSRGYRSYLVRFEVIKRAGHAEVESQPEFISGANK